MKTVHVWLSLFLVLTLWGCSDDDGGDDAADLGEPSDASLDDGSSRDAAVDAAVDAGPPGAVAATIDRPVAGARVILGEPVELAASCTGPDDATLTHDWMLPGGTPPTASTEDPGTATFDTLGPVTIRYTCTAADESATATTAIVVVRDRWVPAIAGELNISATGTDEVVLFDPTAATPTERQLFEGSPLAFPEAAQIRSRLERSTLSPDGRYLTYVANPREESTFDLFLVDLEAEEPSASNLTELPDGGEVSTIAWSPDSLQIAVHYTEDGSVPVFAELLAVEPGGSVTRTSVYGPGDGTGRGAGATSRERWSADSTLYFLTIDAEDIVPEAYVFDVSAPSDGPTRLHPTFDGSAGRRINSVFALDGGRALVVGTLLDGGGRDIALVDRASPDQPPQILTPTPAPPARGVGIGGSTEVVIAPDRSHVLFWSHPNLDEKAMYLADLDAGSPMAIEVGDRVPLADALTGLSWSPESSHYAYAEEGTFRVGPRSSTAPVAVNDPSAGQQLLDAAWAPGSSQLAARGDLRVEGRFEIFAVDPSDGSTTVLHDPLAMDALRPLWLDPETIAFGVEGSTPSIFGVSPAAASPTTDLSGALPTGVFLASRQQRSLTGRRLVIGTSQNELAILVDADEPGSFGTLRAAGGTEMILHWPDVR